VGTQPARCNGGQRCLQRPTPVLGGPTRADSGPAAPSQRPGWSPDISALVRGYHTIEFDLIIDLDLYWTLVLVVSTGFGAATFCRGWTTDL